MTRNYREEAERMADGDTRIVPDRMHVLILVHELETAEHYAARLEAMIDRYLKKLDDMKVYS